MTESLEQYHSTEFELLRELMSGDRKLVHEYRDVYPDELNHLEGYGILTKELEIRIPVLKKWLHTRFAA